MDTTQLDLDADHGLMCLDLLHEAATRIWLEQTAMGNAELGAAMGRLAGQLAGARNRREAYERYLASCRMQAEPTPIRLGLTPVTADHM